MRAGQKQQETERQQQAAADPTTPATDAARHATAAAIDQAAQDQYPVPAAAANDIAPPVSSSLAASADPVSVDRLEPVVLDDDNVPAVKPEPLLSSASLSSRQADTAPSAVRRACEARGELGVKGRGFRDYGVSVFPSRALSGMLPSDGWLLGGAVWLGDKRSRASAVCCLTMTSVCADASAWSNEGIRSPHETVPCAPTAQRSRWVGRVFATETGR